MAIFVFDLLKKCPSSRILFRHSFIHCICFGGEETSANNFFEEVVSVSNSERGSEREVWIKRRVKVFALLHQDRANGNPLKEDY